jgi:predicted PurR-regulated permease PerM
MADASLPSAGLEPRDAPSRFRVAAWLLALAALWLVLRLGLLPALLAGLLVFLLVHVLTARLRFVHERRARMVAVAVVGVVVVGLLSLAAFAALVFFRSESGGYLMLLHKADEIVQSWRTVLPAWAVQALPADPEALRAMLVGWIRGHTAEVQRVGHAGSKVLVRIVIGMVIGALVALRQADPPVAYGPLAAALVGRVVRFAEAFRRIVFAQVRIAAVNAALTALYLAVLLPILGIHLPLVKTMVVLTFVAGLLPVVGNLISNVVVVVVSLSVSPAVAVGSLAYLVAIHKLEYFLNAKLVGHQIEARAWELLLAMLAMEAAFGVAGLVAAPIYYAWLKSELRGEGWI